MVPGQSITIGGLLGSLVVSLLQFVDQQHKVVVLPHAQECPAPAVADRCIEALEVHLRFEFFVQLAGVSVVSLLTAVLGGRLVTGHSSRPEPSPQPQREPLPQQRLPSVAAVSQNDDDFTDAELAVYVPRSRR